MIRLLVFILAVTSTVSLQVAYKSHFQASSTINVTALRAAELQKHNSYRALHGCPALVFNKTLNNIAQNYSTTCANVHKMTRSPGSQGARYGENLYQGMGATSMDNVYKPGAASDAWYSEEKYYNYTTFLPTQQNRQIKHFTAMIWKSVTSVGFGYAAVPENEGFSIYVVANYYPTPNYLGQYRQNVPKKI